MIDGFLCKAVPVCSGWRPAFSPRHLMYVRLLQACFRNDQACFREAGSSDSEGLQSEAEKHLGLK